MAVSGVLFLAAVLLQMSISVNEQGETDDHPITDPNILEGKRLSEVYCGRCHTHPDPALLPWKTWRFETLGAMAPFLGVEDPNTAVSARDQRSNPYIPDNVYPSEPQVTQEEWQKIRDYYLYAAPKELTPGDKVPPIKIDSQLFKAWIPNYQSTKQPSVTAIKFDPGNRLIYLGDSNEKKLMVFDQNLELVHSDPIDSPLSEIEILDDLSNPGPRELLLTFIGYLQPNDAPYGSIALEHYDPSKRIIEMDSLLWDRVARPVESTFTDLDQDGLEDLLVNEFGHRAGSLFWLKNTGRGKPPEKKVLIAKPGCIQSYVMDYTGNGKPDIVALCAQTDQAIYLFENQGNGEFNPKTLLQFDITAGSSSFEIHDFNDDGSPDILYTSGDNADFSKTLKPYHGVYIYLNDGHGRFSNEWFYPINGAYNAKARDFNGNGLLDIAVISYFADYEYTPEEGFLFFKNEGNLEFTPYHHPAADVGRWLTMDVADWTGNGKADIVLANFPEGPMLGTDSKQEQGRNGPYFLLLENLSGERNETVN